MQPKSAANLNFCCPGEMLFVEVLNGCECEMHDNGLQDCKITFMHNYDCEFHKFTIHGHYPEWL